MSNHIKLIQKVANSLKLNISKPIGHNPAFIEIKSNITNKKITFMGTKTSLNDQMVAAIINDKGLTYDLLKASINMPKTLSYIDPQPTKEYLQNYVAHKSYNEIIQDIELNLTYPIILKPISLSQGDNIILIENKEELLKGIEKIFNKNSFLYNHVLLAQDYIQINKEYRVTVFNKNIEIVYHKDNSNGKFLGNLSPLHWQGSKARLINNVEKIKQLQAFINPIFNNIDLVYGGLDIIESVDNNLYLIEINGQPAYDYIIETAGKELVEDLYKKILTKFL